jgi:hypothetical protein
MKDLNRLKAEIKLSFLWERGNILKSTECCGMIRVFRET